MNVPLSTKFRGPGCLSSLRLVTFSFCVQELMAARADLAEATALRQRHEDVLRQRERELTALKGALKEEVSTHDKEIETLREQYRQDMERLRASMEQVSQVNSLNSMQNASYVTITWGHNNKTVVLYLCLSLRRL